ncbi:MAG: phosphoribosylglycinamide formyltransferase [Clostridiales bacterium]|jgi:phosphoribosylglycinamide formyltransferase-1|nr:phosphoribosylglycinamide formyltransferase [Clostridiales bacterium]
MKKRIAVFVSGGGTDFQSVIDAVKRGEIDAEISLLVSSRDGVYALTRAEENSIPSYVFKKKDYADTDEMFRGIDALLTAQKIDVIVLAGYLSILGAEFTKKYLGRIINIHPSLIPKHCGAGYYGIRVHESVIASGDKVTGATVHFVDEGTDTGAVIIQKEIPVLQSDTAESLQQRVLAVEHEILPAGVKLLCEGKVRLVEGKAVFLGNK